MGLVTPWKGKAHLLPSHQQKLQQKVRGPQSMKGLLPNLSLPSTGRVVGEGLSDSQLSSLQ